MSTAATKLGAVAAGLEDSGLDPTPPVVAAFSVGWAVTRSPLIARFL